MAASFVADVREASAETPGLLAATVGLGLCVLERMARLQVAATAFPTYLHMIACSCALAGVLLFAAVVYAARPSARLCRHPVATFAVALACALSVLLAYGAVGWPLSAEAVLVCEVVSQVGANLIMLMWVEALGPYGRKRIVLTLGGACAVAALANMALGTVKSDMENGVLACVPVLSVVCLHYFVEYNTSRSGFSTASIAKQEAMGVKGFGQGMAPTERRTVRSLFAVGTGRTLALLVGFSFAARFCIVQATASWIFVGETTGASVASQLSSSLGMLLAAAIVLLGVRRLDARGGGSSYGMLVFLVLSVALLSVFVLGNAREGLPIALNVAVQLLLVVPAFVEPADWRDAGGMAVSAAIFSALGAGVAVGAVYREVAFAGGFYATVLVAAMAVVGVLALVLANPAETNERSVVAERVLAAVETAEEDPYAVACARLAAAYRLTPREHDILRLLVDRRTNAEIAEDLVISVATVRTHVRNIYAKLDVHSTKELREMCLASGGEDRPEE